MRMKSWMTFLLLFDKIENLVTPYIHHSPVGISVKEFELELWLELNENHILNNKCNTSIRYIIALLPKKEFGHSLLLNFYS